MVGTIEVHTEPVVNPEVRDDVPDKQICPAIGLTDIVESNSRETQTEIAQCDQLRILVLVQGAGKIEVVDAAKPTILLAFTAAFGLTLVVVVSGDVSGKVQQPSKQLLQHHMRCSRNGSLLHEFAQFVSIASNPGRKHLARLGDKHHVAVYVSCSLVVLSVRDLPGEIRDKQK